MKTRNELLNDVKTKLQNTYYLDQKKQELINDCVDELLKSINYMPCSTLLLCLVDEFNFLTKDKVYKMQEEPEGHYVVIDDFGEKRLLWKKYFKIVEQTSIV